MGKTSKNATLDKVSIIIATLNEELGIGSVLEGCLKHSDDIIVVDGHSTDRTIDIAKSYKCRTYLDNKKGKGDALRIGIEQAKNDILVFIDADGSHDANDIPRLIGDILADKADHVQGSRTRGGSDELHGDFEKFARMIGSDIITLSINYRFNVCLTDSQNGFRAMKRSVAKDLNLQENITTIEQEMIMKTLRKGYRLNEVPTHEYARVHGTSKIVLSKVIFRYGYSLVKYLIF